MSTGEMRRGKGSGELSYGPGGVGHRIGAQGWRRKAFLIPASIALAIIVGCTVLLVLLPIDERAKALSAIAEGILLGGVYAIIALGVVVVFKASKVFNLAHGGVLLLASYFLWWLLTSLELPSWSALTIVALSAVLIGLGIYRLFMRRMIGQSGLVTFIMTLVLGFYVIQGLTLLLFKGAPQILPPVFPPGSVTVGEVRLPYDWLSAFLVAVAMFLVFVCYFRYTTGGLIMRSVSEDHVVAQSLGIGVKRVIAISWVVGCLSAAIGGVLLSSMFAVDTSMGSFAMMRALPVLLLGGLESIPGAFIGAIIIGVVETLAGTYIDPYVTGFRGLLPYILMVVIVLLRPHGLFGLKEIRRI